MRLRVSGLGGLLVASAFDGLAGDDPAAMQLLTLVAWLAPEPVPLTSRPHAGTAATT